MTPFWDEIESSYDLQESEGFEGAIVGVCPLQTSGVASVTVSGEWVFKR